MGSWKPKGRGERLVSTRLPCASYPCNRAGLATAFCTMKLALRQPKQRMHRLVIVRNSACTPPGGAQSGVHGQRHRTLWSGAGSNFCAVPGLCLCELALADRSSQEHGSQGRARIQGLRYAAANAPGFAAAVSPAFCRSAFGLALRRGPSVALVPAWALSDASRPLALAQRCLCPLPSALCLCPLVTQRPRTSPSTLRWPTAAPPNGRLTPVVRSQGTFAEPQNSSTARANQQSVPVPDKPAVELVCARPPHADTTATAALCIFVSPVALVDAAIAGS